MYRKTVISLHGIRTRGEWQKQLAPYISAQGWIYHPLDYGHFRALDLLLNIPKKRAKVKWLRKELNTINQTSDGHPPSIIVHSNGSYLLGEVLKKFPDLRFDQVILTGSIIDREFDWELLKSRDQVKSVLNIVGGKDFCSKLAQGFVAGAGNSGSKGFLKSNGIEEVLYENFGHSDAHAHDVFKNQIIPFIEAPAHIPPSSNLANNLPPIRAVEAASWSAATYHKQYVERFRMAVAHKQFVYTDDKSNVIITPNTLKILLPETCSQAESYSRDEIHKHIPGRPILFGNGKDTRSAFLGDDGIVYDLPSIAASFSILDNFHNQQGASSSAIKDFKDIINRIAKGMTGQLDHTVIAEDFKPQKL